MVHLTELYNIPHISRKHIDKYIVFIEKCKLTNKNTSSYVENHHILPRKMFPQYENLCEFPWNVIRLTVSQHIWAHWLLMHGYGGNMIYAFRLMANRGKSYVTEVELIKLLPLLEEARIKAVSQHSIDMKERFRSGKQISAAKNKIWINDGSVDKWYPKDLEIPVGWFKGQCVATKNKKRMGHLDKKHSKEHCDAISRGLTGFKRPLEQNAANSARQLGKKLTQEHKNKTRITMKRKIWINNGVVCTRIDKDAPLPNGFMLGRGWIKKPLENNT